MNIRTFDLFVFFNGYTRTHYNISRTAIQEYVAYYQEENPDYVSFAVANS